MTNHWLVAAERKRRTDRARLVLIYSLLWIAMLGLIASIVLAVSTGNGPR